MLEFVQVSGGSQWLIVARWSNLNGSCWAMRGEGNTSHEEEAKDHRDWGAQSEYKYKVGRIAWEENVRDGGEKERREPETGHDETDGNGPLNAF
jgi:hypothetical protein